MAGLLLILRPEPGAGTTAERARRLGMEAVVAPLFTIRSVEWDAPDPQRFDGLLITSANAPRQAGAKLAEYTQLPCFAVGEASAAAAREAGFLVRSGPGDGAAAVDLAAKTGAKRLLHLCGREHVPLGADGIEVSRVAVYAAEPVPALPPSAVDALRQGAIALVHSARAGAIFAALVDEAGLERRAIGIAAISAAASAAAGEGWKRIAAATAPRDEALLELAAKLCKTEGGETRKSG